MMTQISTRCGSNFINRDFSPIEASFDSSLARALAADGVEQQQWSSSIEEATRWLKLTIGQASSRLNTRMAKMVTLHVLLLARK